MAWRGAGAEGPPQRLSRGARPGGTDLGSRARAARARRGPRRLRGAPDPRGVFFGCTRCGSLHCVAVQDKYKNNIAAGTRSPRPPRATAGRNRHRPQGVGGRDFAGPGGVAVGAISRPPRSQGWHRRAQPSLCRTGRLKPGSDWRCSSGGSLADAHCSRTACSHLHTVGAPAGRCVAAGAAEGAMRVGKERKEGRQPAGGRGAAVRRGGW